ncbi:MULTISPECIES: DHH family phosphoesterase [Halobacterium]|uniref:DHH family phosphoesterase n=1 Tax=Halobacterium TaxID=2239 RepID=UPI0019665111|nr:MULTISPECIES: DHH family phosphoesterase [unclassified Halobacterium]QRY22486.1 DHH family phosphoesterase [Halobacterium sp. GSL-19]QRY24566.1 DHH family phosphoesterase [Halobacterium sp. BOL4-2]
MDTDGPPVPALAERAAACADALRDADSVLVASHIDADGLTSAGIASTALERAAIPHEVVFSKQLDDEEIADIAGADHGTVLFTDFGSGQLDAITAHERAGEFTPVIADHHQPAENAATDCHLNPLLEGVDGGTELSGAGATYVLARALLGTDATDLAALAVVGAVGDRQTVDGELVGANTRVAADGVEAGVLDTATGLALYGTQTRPLPRLLEYASELYIPGITNDHQGAIRFLDALDVDLHDGGDWRTWASLDHDERRTVVSALVKRAVRTGVPSAEVTTLVGTTYTLTDEEPGTALRDASEFATLLNATARYERADVGLAVCMGDRGDALERARSLREEHRQTLSEGVSWVTREGVTVEDDLQWFHADDRIRETIVGIVAGMALSGDETENDRPIVAFAAKDDEPAVKVSARATARVVDAGVDLAVVVREAAAAAGGDGGGHEAAAGATVPAGNERAFLDAASGVLAAQRGGD